MKKILLTLLLISFFLTGSGQDTINYWSVYASSNFNQPHYPFTNSLTMWILKQKYELDIYQAEIGKEIPVDKDFDYSKTRMNAEFYLPFFKLKAFSSTIGVSYYKSYILSETDSLSRSLYENCYIWLPIQVQFERFKIIALYENFGMGDNNSVFSKTGNMQRVFLTSVFAISTKWHLMVLGAYVYKNLESETEHTFIPAAQLRYQPNSDMEFIVGAPVFLAFDIRFLKRFDLSFSQMLFDETEALLRYSITDNIALSISYLSTNHSNSEIFFKSETLMLNNEVIMYNNLTQKQDCIALKIGFKTFDNIGFIISGGYNSGRDAELFLNRTKVNEVNGVDEFFVGFHLQYLKF